MKKITPETIVGAAFMCGLEQMGVTDKEEIRMRIEAFEHSKGYKEILFEAKKLMKEQDDE